MAQTKIEKINNIEEEITRLRDRQKLLKQQHYKQERKDRTHRLCRRGGLWESLVPDTISLTDEQFQTFLEKTIMTKYAGDILSNLMAQNIGNVAKTQDKADAQGDDTTTGKPTTAPEGNASAVGANRGNG